MKDKIRKILKYSLLLIISIYYLYSAYYVYTHPYFTYTKECGKIISKSNDEVSIKHGSRTDLYLNVQFDNRFESVLVDPTTYFGNHKGEEICFNFTDKMTFKNFWNYLLFIVISVILILVGIAQFIVYIFGL